MSAWRESYRHLSRSTGHEAGAIVHVPSTRDLLATVPVPAGPLRAVRRHAGSWAVSLETLAGAPYEPAGSPRKSRDGGVTEFACLLGADEAPAPRGRSSSWDGRDAWGTGATAAAARAQAAAARASGGGVWQAAERKGGGRPATGDPDAVVRLLGGGDQGTGAARGNDSVLPS